MNLNLISSSSNILHKVLIEDNRWKLYVNGLQKTLLISVIAIIIGVLLGLIIAVIKNINENTGKIKILALICDLYVNIIRGIPMMLQLFIVYFVVFANWDNSSMVASIAFGLNSAAYVAEIFRGGLTSVDKGQMEAGRSLGLGYGQTMGLIIVPQALRNAIPPLGNEFIALIKETAIVGSIGILDLTKAANMISTRTFEFLLPLAISAILYLLLVILLTSIMKFIERRLRKGDIR